MLLLLWFGCVTHPCELIRMLLIPEFRYPLRKRMVPVDPKNATAYWFLCVLLATSGLVRAEQLPIKVYSTADGLPSTQIRRIVRDSRGLMWFCTVDGCSL